MKKIIALILFLLFQTALFSNSVPGEFIVMLKKDEKIENLIEKISSSKILPLKIERVLSENLNIWLISTDIKVDYEKFLPLLEQSPLVLAAQLNHTDIIDRAITPNDTYFPQQWALSKIGAPNAWDISKGGVTAAGDTVVVAVLESGMKLGHEDINYWKNSKEIPKNGKDDDGNGYIDDYNGWNVSTKTDVFTVKDHGLHVAGIVSGKPNNGKGIAGVNWFAKMLPIQRGETEAQIVEAFNYALNMRKLYNESNGQKGAFVVATNGSFGMDKTDPAKYPVWAAIYDKLGEVGILSVASTANANYNIDIDKDMPTSCSSDYLVTVTNTMNDDTKHSSAGYGKTTIDLGAPGTSIYSTWGTNSYSSQTGTSMASPYVAASISVMVSALKLDVLNYYKNNPATFALTLKKMILDNVDKVSSLTNQTVSGGRLNLFKSVQAANSLVGIENNFFNKEASLEQNYPNPFNPETTIKYTVTKESNVSIIIYNNKGEKISTLINKKENKGCYTTSFNGRDLPSGIYYYSLKINNQTIDSKKMILLK